ncbi:MAG: hypothetical protein EB127_03355 [Alphaproteobacteria bacterium]|nr:hypothetical protein [Alphaproteobacteria bacterium]
MFSNSKSYYNVGDSSAYTSALKKATLTLSYDASKPPKVNANTYNTPLTSDYQASNITPHNSTFGALQARTRLFSPSGGIRR